MSFIPIYFFNAAAAIRRRNENRKWFCKDKSYMEAMKKVAPDCVTESERGFYFEGSYSRLTAITERWNINFVEA